MKSAFVSSVTLPRQHCMRPTVCRRGPPAVACAEGPSHAAWQNSPNYQKLGTGIQSKGIQTIEFCIHPNGIVEEKVTGVRGKHCAKLTEKIEEELGNVVNVQQTGEYYDNNDVVVERNVERNGQSHPYTWPGGEGYPTW
ncbi:unnamed protein product [Agarophyton chilense]|eukprot:gb/GEZJ01002812.1/.p2 GENE.gb/GEZJ01002812.1/~~gb/GEZJ01002812.1/.p2  ORF type:complete len:139 (-),score=15.88 gb/GEZJ01002812.1/:357-773(-)